VTPPPPDGALAPLVQLPQNAALAAEAGAGATFQISPLGVILFLGVGLGLFALMRGLRCGVRITRLPRRRKAALETGVTVLETLVGLAYILSAIPMIFRGQPQHSPYFAIIVVAGVIWVAWVATRELLHGVFFKAGRGCRPGDQITVGEVKGTVKRLGFKALIVMTPRGEEVQVPYSRLSRETLVRVPASVGAVRHAFQLSPPAEVPLSQVAARVRLAAFSSHWASAAHEPEVELVGDGRLEVGVFALDALRGPEIEAAVRAAVEGG